MGCGSSSSTRESNYSPPPKKDIYIKDYERNIEVNKIITDKDPSYNDKMPLLNKEDYEESLDQQVKDVEKLLDPNSNVSKEDIDRFFKYKIAIDRVSDFYKPQSMSDIVDYLDYIMTENNSKKIEALNKIKKNIPSNAVGCKLQTNKDKYYIFAEFLKILKYNSSYNPELLNISMIKETIEDPELKELFKSIFINFPKRPSMILSFESAMYENYICNFDFLNETFSSLRYSSLINLVLFFDPITSDSSIVTGISSLLENSTTLKTLVINQLECTGEKYESLIKSASKSKNLELFVYRKPKFSLEEIILACEILIKSKSLEVVVLNVEKSSIDLVEKGNSEIEKKLKESKNKLKLIYLSTSSK